MTSHSEVYGGIHLPPWGITIHILKWYKIVSICLQILDCDKIMTVTKNKTTTTKKHANKKERERVNGADIRKQKIPTYLNISFADIFPAKRS